MASKLEMYVDILRVLEKKGPLEASQIKPEENHSATALKGKLEFLIQQGLIEEQTVGKNSIVYANTSRGMSVIKFFKELDKTLTILDDENSNISSLPY
jgi:predicted transcriptional regulator